MNLRAFVIAALLIGATRGQPPAGSTREDAYRANNLGVALLEQFNSAQAVAAFREALRLVPDLGLAHFNLALALIQENDLSGAATEAAAADRLMPSAAQPPYVLGLVARAENRDADAVRYFQRVREIDPRDVGTAINLAQIRIQNREYADAASMLRPAVADEPFNITAAYNLGLALMRSGARDEGQRMMEHSQELRATGYGVTLSNGYLEQGRYAEALASTGTEPDLVDTSIPSTTFETTTIASSASPIEPAFGRSFAAGDLTPAGVSALASSLGGGVALIDVDGDGDLDIFTANASGQHLWKNDGGRFSDVTAAAGLGSVPIDSVAIGCIAGDLDNDGNPDLFVLRNGTSTIYKNDGRGHFAAVAFAPIPFLPGAAALVDVDHDGDLDIVVAGLADINATRAKVAGGALQFPRDFAPAPMLLFRNNGSAVFVDVTREAKINEAGHAIGIVPTDYDNRRDIDLLIVYADRPPALLKNLRDGTFGNVTADVGLDALNDVTSVTAGDINKDDFPDFVFGNSRGWMFAISDGRGRYTMTATVVSDAPAVEAVQLVDYDNDGLLDLIVWRSDGARVQRNLGRSWVDATSAFAPSRGLPAPTARGVAIADLDDDGAEDLVTMSPNGTLAISRATGGANRSIRVRLKGRVSNRGGIGSKVQIRAGSLSHRVETSAATPSVAPSDVVLGLGRRATGDVVRVLWPSGVLQAELAAAPSPDAPPLVSPQPLPSRLEIEELNRKPSSCPFLYTWNGERFEFITDFMGGGEMGYWEGPRTFNHPDPIEFVRIPANRLRPSNGRYELRVTNELEETLFVDRLELVSVAHPAEIEVFPNEGMTDPPKPFRVFAVKDSLAPAAVLDEHGHDVTDLVRSMDRRYPDDFDKATIRGYAAPHALEIDLGDVPPNPVLLLTGWTDYAFSSDNVAAAQAGLAMMPPSLEVRSRSGKWEKRIADIGIPVGRPQTVPVDLTGVLRAGEHIVRVSTNMRVMWDQIRVGSGVVGRVLSDPARPLLVADLRERGFSAEIRPDGQDPPTYDYASVKRESPWKVMTGRYTRVGDVLALLQDADDMFVIAKPGDEIALSFDASHEPPLPAGWVRTFLLKADGYSKEMDINSATPDRVEPLPFHGMTTYPYKSSERYPSTPAHDRYRAELNTRVVR